MLLCLVYTTFWKVFKIIKSAVWIYGFCLKKLIQFRVYYNKNNNIENNTEYVLKTCLKQI